MYHTAARARAAITGGASTIAGSNLTKNMTLISNSNGKVAVSSVTSTELGYLTGVTSNIQTQLNGKASSTVETTIATHTANKDNPHGVTKAQVGLSNVDNTADADKSVNYASSSTRTRYITSPDTKRTEYDIPGMDAKTGGVCFDFKQKSISGLMADYSGIMTYRPYSTGNDWTGGPAHQLAFDTNGLHWRKYDSSGFSNWKNISFDDHTHTKANITDFPTSLPASDVYDWAKAASKPNYAFNEISAGNATIGNGANQIFLRTDASWASTIYHHTTSDEAVVFLNKGKNVNGTSNYTTSWIFAYGTPADRPTWNTLTPALQIKGECVAINKLIGSQKAGSYNLDVSGTANATTLYENGTRVALSGHTHTKSEVGLGNVDNTADANKSVNYANTAGSSGSCTGNAATASKFLDLTLRPTDSNYTETQFNLNNINNTAVFINSTSLSANYYSAINLPIFNNVNAGEVFDFGTSSGRVQLFGGYRLYSHSSKPTGLYYRKASESTWDSWKEIMAIDSSGNICTTHTKNISTSGTFSAAGGFYETSDERLKDFSESIPVDFEKLKKLKKNYFTWKDSNNTDIQIGVSAQEIKEIYPEIVSQGSDGKLQVAYDKLSVVALAAIDKLEDRVKVLEEKLEMLMNKLR